MKQLSIRTVFLNDMDGNRNTKLGQKKTEFHLGDNAKMKFDACKR